MHDTGMFLIITGNLLSLTKPRDICFKTSGPLFQYSIVQRTVLLSHFSQTRNGYTSRVTRRPTRILSKLKLRKTMKKTNFDDLCTYVAR